MIAADLGGVKADKSLFLCSLYLFGLYLLLSCEAQPSLHGRKLYDFDMMC